MVVPKHDGKKEAKIGANLEAKIGTYLKVKRGAKWDAKVVAQMDAILDVNLDANMVLTGMSFRKQKWTLSRKQIGCYLGSKPRRCLGSKVGHYSRSKKIDAILDVIKDAI